MRHRLALYTFGVFAKPADDPANDGFHRLNDGILAFADRAAGLIARSGYADEPGPSSWGEQVFPRFYVERGDGWSPSTLSLWTDAEAAMAFSYFGPHAAALKRGSQWMKKPEWPPHAAWWVDASHTPDWTEAVERHHMLHEFGPTPRAFDFKRPFDADGNAFHLDESLIRSYAEQNSRSGTCR